MSKARRSMDHAERIAKLVVEAALPGTEMVFRDEQSHGECDFDLHYPNETHAAVEVTESADQLQKDQCRNSQQEKRWISYQGKEVPKELADLPDGECQHFQN
jgi:hypothetical protein